MFSKINPGINILYEPNETIVLNVSKNQENKYQIHYEGRNSSILLAINVDSIYKYQKFSQKLRSVIFEANRGSDILNFVKNEHKLESERLKFFFEKGELILPSTKKPSEGQVLYDEILNALKI